MSQVSLTAETSGWNAIWERDVYGQGRALNRYPFDQVVAFVMSTFGSHAERANVRLLEVGCGAGNNLWFAAREGFSVSGIDGSSSAITYARQRFEQDGLSGDLHVGDFTQLPWPDHRFDAVIDRVAWSTTTREHIQTAISEARRVLKPDGQLLSIAYSDEHPDREMGVHRGGHDYADFQGGRLEGLGNVHFFTRAEVDELYGTSFVITGLSHLKEVEQLAGQRRGTAYWRIIGQRLG